MTTSKKNKKEKVQANRRGIRKDGFVFLDSGLEAVLADYLYRRTPEGKRRDQMKRLMIIGLIQELGIKPDREAYIPPPLLGYPDISPLMAVKNDILGLPQFDQPSVNHDSRLKGTLHDDLSSTENTEESDPISSSSPYIGTFNGNGAEINRGSSSNMINRLTVSAFTSFRG